MTIQTTPVARRSLLNGAAGAAAMAGLAVHPHVATAAEDMPIATTSHGKVRGAARDGISVFKGIRYGADTAPRRFMPPLPPEPWTGVQNATSYGPASPQSKNPPGEEMGEDCLFLNLWTPGLRDGGKRPVMFYIHGGAYNHGSGASPLYDGTRLCQRGDVVVVTVNHRLNAMGYLYLARLAGPEMADSGNAGMLDLVLALHWVRDNIAEFGGDPGNVMLFGQSGGGAKIATLMAMPAAAGLFHRAATMSGQQLTASGPLNATRRAEAYLAALGLTPERAEEARHMPLAQLTAALKATDPVIGAGSLYFGPVLDERSLNRHPFYPDAPTLSAHIPMIIGNTHDETRNLIGNSEPDSFNLAWEEVAPRLARHMRVDIHPEMVVAEYRKLYPHYSPSDVFFAATTAGRSWRAAVVEAELRAIQGSPVYAYQLDWGSPLDGGKWGAPHMLDIPLVFGTLDAEESITGTAADAREVSGRMMDAFIAFARTGNPNCPSVPEWQPYTLPRRETMVFDSSTRLENDPRGAERALFAKVPFIQQGT
ncbi:carboxylesterase/lipase family protein [Indioceanicola profundi]|uniref:carboxylesterase/lipase family protein n=1 Tax=Indioceanicola profundi TaxID=2220096 RepID=UPI000E6ABE3A|nr:carboxylesterase/lipase family protein [Indioceanicola profundi]